ncbi:MAG: ergothioneine biosynthesis protein EgtB [Pseudomonadota bacterium]
MPLGHSADSRTEHAGDALIEHYSRVRQRTLDLIDGLHPEDAVVQSMDDTSPTKWHLAHTAWFFEQFILREHMPAYEPLDARYAHLFNSYYETVGPMHARTHRGLLSRPTLSQIIDYRKHVDTAMLSLLEMRFEALMADASRGRGPRSAAHDAKAAPADSLADIITIGLHHEQQHQELLLTDIQHVLSCNPLRPALREHLPAVTGEATQTTFESFVGGIVSVGVDQRSTTFSYDNESPRHRALLEDFEIANALVTNGEYKQFIADGGYHNAALWLSDGWACVNQHQWRAPLYWLDGHEQQFTLGGVREIDDNAPVAYLSLFEADAFARWAGARLPSEIEWEHCAAQQSVSGNFAESDLWQPAPGAGQWFGDVWEWTASAYLPYPGFKPLNGALGEYNGKFMSNQMVVRGGSALSAQDHLRATYRSFFYPHQRWQCLGLRLARST